MNVNTDSISIDFSKAETIAEGNDSHVFLYEGLIYKEYQTLQLDWIQRYVGFMNQAVAQIETINYRDEIPIEGVAHSFHFKGVPVKAVGMGPRDRPIAVSDYVPEPNLDKLTQPPAKFSKYPLVRVSSQKNQVFFQRLNQLFHEELPTRTKDLFLYHVDIISRRLDTQLGVFGSYIGKYNTKILPNLETREMTFLVTDLAVYMERFHI